VWVADLVGSGLAHYDLLHPDDRIRRLAFARPSPTGNHLALYFTDFSMDHRLFIFELPHLRLIMEIPLIGHEAKRSIEEYKIENTGFVNSPIQTSISHTESNLMWSPDGRFIAFVAAIEGTSSDIYVYDTLRHEYGAVTNHENQAFIMEWSPDSEWIIHASISGIDVTVGIDAVWAVSPHGGEVHYLYKAHPYVAGENIVGWRNASTFLVQSSYFEGCPGDVVMVSIPDGDSEVLLDDRNTKVAYDPINKTLAYIKAPEGGFCSSSDPGLYTLDIRTGEREQIFAGIYGLYGWLPNGYAFQISDIEKGEIAVVSAGGSVLFRFPFEADIFPSPNGQYFLVSSSEQIDLYSREGYFLRQTPSHACDEILWMQDSTGFIRVPNCGERPLQVYFYLETLEWQEASQLHLPTTSESSAVFLVEQ
jgi:WD40 repeat protein